MVKYGQRFRRLIIRLSDNVYDTIVRVHNSSIGHRGIDAAVYCKTMAISENIRKDVGTFIQQCPSCQKSNVRKVAYNNIPSRPQPKYRRRGSISMHSNVNTLDAVGFTACLVVIDTCTHWAESYPISV